MNKKGVSPLLAAVLLIAFAIAMAAVVSTYVLEKTKEFDPNVIAQQSVFCESVTLGYTADDSIEIYNPTDASGAPISDVDLIGNITLVNRGSFSIHRLIISSPGLASADYPLNVSGNPPLEPGSNNKRNVSIQIDNSNDNKEIKIVPVIKDPEKNQFVSCADRQLIINYTQLCIEVIPGATDCPGP